MRMSAITYLGAITRMAPLYRTSGLLHCGSGRITRYSEKVLEQADPTSVRIVDHTPRTRGPALNPGVFLPDCWMEGLLSPGINISAVDVYIKRRAETALQSMYNGAIRRMSMSSIITFVFGPATTYWGAIYVGISTPVLVNEVLKKSLSQSDQMKSPSGPAEPGPAKPSLRSFTKAL